METIVAGGVQRRDARPPDDPAPHVIGHNDGVALFLPPPTPIVDDVVLHLANVTVRRGQALLLDDVSWRARAAERWVILGPNGAGKSTLIALAAARLHPTSGTVRILGEQLGRVNVADLRPRIGLSTATLAGQVPPQETVRDVVVSAGYGVVGRWRERYDEMDFDRADELIAAMGVSALADRAFGVLSSGERKRVLAARALMTDPEMLLLDEPAAGLDLSGREDLLARLTILAADPYAPTSVLVTHHVEEIPVGYSHVLLLRAGRTVAAGPIGDTLTDETLSAAFGMSLQLQARRGRFFAYAG
jgi:iron complex transport system ATP-binding protein